MKNTLIFGAFLAVMVCIGTIAGCALTNAMTGESPVAIVMRWREEGAAHKPKQAKSPSKNVKDDSEGEQSRQKEDESESAKDNEPSEITPDAATNNNQTMGSSGDIGNNHVEIKGAYLATDYEGNPAVVVTYAWTNNSDETTNSFSSVHAKAFQDGVQLDNATIGNKEVFDSSSYLKDVRPGTTIDVQNAFVLTSETSTIEVEIAELISISDEKVVMDFDPENLS